MSLKIAHRIAAYNMQGDLSIVGQAVLDSHGLPPGTSYSYKCEHSCDLVGMRNRILDNAIRDGFDFLYSQDADVFCEGRGPLPQLLSVALDTGATITGACVMMRKRPPFPNVWPAEGDSFSFGEVFEARKIGTGMVLIDLRKIREWYVDFQGPCFARSYEIEERDGKQFNRMIHSKIGSDIWFSKVVRAHGGTIWCDARIETVHVDGTHRHDFNGHVVPVYDPADSGEDLADQGNDATGA